METRNVSLYKDTGRTIIVLEGTDSNFDEAILKLITGLKVSTVEGLQPAKEQSPEEKLSEIKEVIDAGGTPPVLINQGEYQNVSPDTILNKDCEKGLVFLFHFCENKSASLITKREIILACKKFMKALPERIKNFDADRSVEFVKNISSIVPIKVFLNGYASVDDFINIATEEEIQLCTVNIAKHLESRGAK